MFIQEDMKLKVYYNIFKLRNDWERLSKENVSLTPFQYFNYNKNLFWDRWLNVFKTRLVPVFVSISDSNKIIMIAPFLKTLRNNYFMLGDIQGCGLTDFIYSNSLNDSQILECISLLRNHCKYIHVGRLLCTSRFFEVYNRANEIGGTQRDILINVKFGDDYDEYYKALTKHVRQNLRTSYNRLKSDNIEYSFEVIDNLSMTSAIWNGVSNIYCKRQKDAYGASGVWMDMKNKYLKHDSISLRYNDNLFCAILKYGNEIAAVLMGLINYEKTTIIVPRLAINTDFYHYSPGNQLVNECIKYLIEKTKVRNLDLSRGTEQYKYMMGGEEYQTVNFDIVKKQ